MDTKRCSKCKAVKPICDFHLYKKSKDGLSPYCKQCLSEYNRKYREANPEKIKECRRRYYEANPEKIKERRRRHYEANSEKIKECCRRYYEANPEKIKERVRKYRETNPEKIKEYRKRYSEANQDKIKERNRKYREANQEKIRKDVKELTNWYVRNNLLYKKGFDSEHITDELIEIQRLIIKTKRLCKTLEN